MDEKSMSRMVEIVAGPDRNGDYVWRAVKFSPTGERELVGPTFVSGFPPGYTRPALRLKRTERLSAYAKIAWLYAKLARNNVQIAYCKFRIWLNESAEAVLVREDMFAIHKKGGYAKWLKPSFAWWYALARFWLFWWRLGKWLKRKTEG